MADGASTASPPILTPTSSHFNIEKWQRQVEDRFYQAGLFYPRIKERDKPGSLLHVRKHARAGWDTLGQGAVGTGLNYQDMTPTEVTLDPGEIYVAAGWADHEANETDVPLDSEMASILEMALEEGTEYTALQAVGSLTTNVFGNAAYRLNAAGVRYITGRLGESTRGNVAPDENGKQRTIYALIPWLQNPDAMSIPEYAQADMRGDSVNPHVQGYWSKGGGVMLMRSSSPVFYSNADGIWAPFWVPDAFGIAWNQRPKVYREQVELQYRIILRNNFAVGVVNDDRAGAIKVSSAEVVPA